ncbi:MAG: radical SAM protein [Deltaproteobacteria bacterium]|nr:radical SAM protein [Deltaproteobacteria bacterium]
MRSATLEVTRRCDHSCGFCASPDDGRADPPFTLLTRLIDDAATAGATEVRISGGDPLRRADLEQLVRRCAERGFTTIEVYTPGVRLPPRVDALIAAGVTRVAVPVATMTPTTHRELISQRTHPKHVLAGIAAALQRGLEVAIDLPLSPGLPSAAARIGGLHAAMPALKRFVLVPSPGCLEGPCLKGQGQALAEELDEAARLAEKLRIEVELSERIPLPPCAVELSGRARRLLSRVLREQEGAPNEAHPACATCALATRCTASATSLSRALGGRAPLAIADATPFLRPGKSAGSRLRVLGARDVEKFFHVDYEYGAEVDRPTSRIGIIYRCNQVCRFCELADMDTDLPAERVRGALDEAFARGSRRVILTGGEPTLSPDLLDHVRYARSLGFEEIELQTNAVLLERGDRARALREAGLTSAQISLHGPDPAISDRLTAAPGTHDKTLRGVDALLAAGVRCLLNHLVFVDNAPLLVDFVELVAARWASHRELITVQFHSVRNEFPSVEEGRAHVARYRDYAPTRLRAIDRARALGVRTHDLQDPTGIPSLCVLGADESYLGPIRAQVERPRLHAWETEWMTRVPACSDCSLSRACMGVPRHYLALHGADEFRAL